jgi:hypothetical protein
MTKEDDPVSFGLPLVGADASEFMILYTYHIHFNIKENRLYFMEFQTLYSNFSQSV